MAPFYYVLEQIVLCLEREVCSVAAARAPVAPVLCKTRFAPTVCLFSLLIYVNFSLHAKIKY